MRFVPLHLGRCIAACMCLVALPFVFLVEWLMYWGEQFLSKYGWWIAAAIAGAVVLGMFGMWPAQ